MSQATAFLKWGHELLAPDGTSLRVPFYAFGKLRKLGLLQNNKNRLSPAIYEFLDPQHDCITMGLRHLLGEDLSGPLWLVCRCEECKARYGNVDPDMGRKVAEDVMSHRNKTHKPGEIRS